MSSIRCFAAGLFILVLCGCGPKVNVAPASGIITLDGTPLVNVNISTQPVETGGSTVVNPGSEGITDENGRYTLNLLGLGTPGAVIGEHAVYITFGKDPTHQPPGSNNPKIPARYWNGSVGFTVPEEGSSDLNFELTSKR